MASLTASCRPRLAMVAPVWRSTSALPVIGVARGAARVELMCPCLWLAWMCLSSMQLFELKYFLGKRPLGLAFGEKVLVLSSILVGQVCGIWPFGRFDEPESASVAAVPALVTGVLLLCLYSSTSLMRLASMRDHEAFVQEVIAESQEAWLTFWSIQHGGGPCVLNRPFLADFRACFGPLSTTV